MAGCLIYVWWLDETKPVGFQSVEDVFRSVAEYNKWHEMKMNKMDVEPFVIVEAKMIENFNEANT